MPDSKAMLVKRVFQSRSTSPTHFATHVDDLGFGS